MSNEKLIDKIEKLLRLSQSSNAHEAAAALEKATQLMEEHNLTQTHIARRQISTFQLKSSQSVSKPKDWENSLMHLVAKAFGCRLIWVAGYSRNIDYWGRWEFVGDKTQLKLAEFAAVFLLRQLVAQRTKFMKELQNLGYRRGPHMTAQLDGFCKGWLKTVRSKVHAFALDDETAKIIDDYVQEKCNGKTQDPDNRGSGRLGAEAGMIAASDVSIHRPMDQEVQLKLG